MPGYTKAEYTAQYRTYAVDPDTGAVYDRYRNPALYGDQAITLALHYHPAALRSMFEQRAQQLIDQKGINASDSLIIFGGAWGWLGSALKALLPGLEACSVDLSDYVQQTKDSSPDDDLIESIRAGGLDETTGIGLELFNKFSDPAPRADIPILSEDLSNNGSRNRVRSALPRNPTRIITEEVWQTLSPAEQTLYQDRLGQFGIELIHIIDGIII